MTHTNGWGDCGESGHGAGTSTESYINGNIAVHYGTSCNVGYGCGDMCMAGTTKARAGAGHGTVSAHVLVYRYVWGKR